MFLSFLPLANHVCEFARLMPAADPWAFQVHSLRTRLFLLLLLLIHLFVQVQISSTSNRSVLSVSEQTRARAEFIRSGRAVRKDRV